MKKNLLTRIEENAALVDRTMKEYLSAEGRPQQPLIDAMRYSACEGGKRIRPFLTLEFCRALGGRDEAALPYAAALEMIHTYSLIHDDLPCMDNDDTRRGKPSNHKAFGEATALLAGDALLTYAFAVAAGNRYSDAVGNLRAVLLLAERSGFDGMAGGQMLDLLGEREPLSKDTFLLMNRLKTGCLIRCAAQLGCLAAGYGEQTEAYRAADRFGSCVGLAFQIEDDLLDAGTEEGKTTFLSFMAPEAARKKIKELTETALEAVGAIDGSCVLREFAAYLTERTV